MYCNNCGAQLPDGSNYCTVCGTSQNNGVAAVSLLAPVASVSAVRTQPASTQPGG